jgi:hypothetical protein
MCTPKYTCTQNYQHKPAFMHVSTSECADLTHSHARAQHASPAAAEEIEQEHVGMYQHTCIYIYIYIYTYIYRRMSGMQTPRVFHGDSTWALQHRGAPPNTCHPRVSRPLPSPFDADPTKAVMRSSLLATNPYLTSAACAGPKGVPFSRLLAAAARRRRSLRCTRA